MNIAEAESHLRNLFDVTEKRYAETLAIFHLSQASRLFSIKTDVFFDRYLIDSSFVPQSTAPTDPNLSGSISLTDLGMSSRALEFGYLIRGWYKTSDGRWERLPKVSYEEAMYEYGDDTASTPSVLIIEGDKVFFRPIPSATIFIRLQVKGHSMIINSGTNTWLQNHPFAVIHLAAEWACSHLMEDKRIPVFRSMWQDELMEAGIDASMISTGEPEQAVEPG